jgi:hypothetical protein
MAVFVKSTDATEETSLLQDVGTHTTHDQVFERFSSRWKRLIVAMVSFCGILPCEPAFSVVMYYAYLKTWVQCSFLGRSFRVFHKFRRIWVPQGPLLGARCKESCQRQLILSSLAVSASISAGSIGALTSSTYSTFCEWTSPYHTNSSTSLKQTGDDRFTSYFFHSLPLARSVLPALGPSPS